MNDASQKIEVHIPADAGDKPVDLFQHATSLSRQRIKRAMQLGAAWITRGRDTQRLRRASRVLKAGDEIHLYYDEQVLAQVAPEPALISDRGEYSVWFKPRGMRSQGSKWGDHCALPRWVERNLQPERPAFTVHRLDRAANGLMLVAHAKKTAAALSALFRDRRVGKEYRALVHGLLPDDSQPLRVTEALDDREAVSVIQVLDANNERTMSLVNVGIETGRKHQIRRHLAGLGNPVVGDRLYGSGADHQRDLQLTAVRLRFRCPVTDEDAEFVLDGAYLAQAIDQVGLDG